MHKLEVCGAAGVDLEDEGLDISFEFSVLTLMLWIWRFGISEIGGSFSPSCLTSPGDWIFLGKMGGALRLHISISLLRPLFFLLPRRWIWRYFLHALPDHSRWGKIPYHETLGDMEVVMTCGCWFSNSCRPSFWKHSWKLCWCTY